MNKRKHKYVQCRAWEKTHALKIMKQRRKSSTRRKLRNKYKNHLSKSARRSPNQFTRRYGHYTTVFAPDTLSMIKNPEEMLDFIKDLSANFDSRKKTFVDLKDVAKITYGGLVVLLSIMVKFKAKKIKFDGSFPKNKDVGELLNRSGFFENLYKKQFKRSDHYLIETGSKGGIFTHANKRVESKLTSGLIESASKFIWGNIRRCPGVQRCLVELMLNTNNHADVDTRGKKHWWLSVQHIESEHKVTFSFVDFGVGIFTNLENKKHGSKFFRWKEKIGTQIKYGGNAELLRLILEGKLHKTVTGKPYRGKGLPGIAEAARRNQISHLHIITNDVYCDYENQVFKKLNNNFSGTFIYWEVNKKNENKK